MATIKTGSGRKRAPKKNAPKQKIKIIFRDRECDKEHGEIKLQEKTVTENGTVTPDAGFDGLSKVNVNVSGGVNIDAIVIDELYLDMRAETVRTKSGELAFDKYYYPFKTINGDVIYDDGGSSYAIVKYLQANDCESENNTMKIIWAGSR